MNKEEQQQIINSNKRKYLDLKRKLYENVIPTNKDTSPDHEKLQYLAASKIIRSGCKYICNAYLKSGQIADLFIIDLKNPIIIEIAISETQKSIDYKNKTYPCKIIWVKDENDLQLL